MQAAQRAVSGAAAFPAAPARRPAAAGAATTHGWRAGASRLPVVGSLSRRELLGSGAAAAALLPPLAAQASGAGAPVAAAAAAAPSAAPSADVQLRPLQLETDANGIQRVALQPEGGCWERWGWWRGCRQPCKGSSHEAACLCLDAVWPVCLGLLADC